MLRFFRKYLMNKWVLAVGGCVLMVIFLLPAGFRRGTGGPDPVLGTIGGQKVRQSELRNAGYVLETLGRVHPLLEITAAKGRDRIERQLQWVLMLHEARQLGISASQDEAYALLASLNLTDADVQRASRALSVNPPYVLEALRQYAVVWRYKAPMYGLAQIPMRDRLQLYQLLYGIYGPQALAAAEQLMPAILGYPRLSQPLTERVLYDQGSTVKITVVPLSAQHFGSQMPQPSPQRLQELFQQYRDTPPGQGPTGIGFRIPSRVKLAYLAIPMQRLLQNIHVTEADALAYYDEHRAEFVTPATTQPSTLSYAQVRRQVVDKLVRQRGQDLAQRMTTRAAILMLGPTGRLPQQDGYYVLPADWTPPYLPHVADLLQSEFGVRPDVRVYDQNWLTASDLAQLPDIGGANLSGRRVAAPFADYVVSARELDPSADNVLVQLEHLQVGAPSQLLVDEQGNRYLFRLIEAEPQRAPKSLDQVSGQVEEAARKLDAYDKLLADSSQWVERAKEQGLEAVAASLGETPLQPPPFPRVQQSRMGGLSSPQVLGLPPQADFAQKVFQALLPLSATTQPAPGRLAAIPVPATATLYLVRLDEYQPMPRHAYDQAASQALKELVAASLGLPAADDPLSLEALARRLDVQGNIRQDIDARANAGQQAAQAAAAAS